jgi:hypothetical protein
MSGRGNHDIITLNRYIEPNIIAVLLKSAFAGTSEKKRGENFM